MVVFKGIHLCHITASIWWFARVIEFSFPILPLLNCKEIVYTEVGEFNL
jgi:hypothetical protein